jgi:hypothetical protein
MVRAGEMATNDGAEALRITATLNLEIRIRLWTFRRNLLPVCSE